MESFPKLDKSRSHPTDSLALVPKCFRLPCGSQYRLGPGFPQHGKASGLLQVQPAPQPGVDLGGLSEELRIPVADALDLMVLGGLPPSDAVLPSARRGCPRGCGDHYGFKLSSHTRATSRTLGPPCVL